MNNKTKENLVSDLDYLLESHSDRIDGAQYDFANSKEVDLSQPNKVIVPYSVLDAETGSNVGKMVVTCELQLEENSNV